MEINSMLPLKTHISSPEHTSIMKASYHIQPHTSTFYMDKIILLRHETWLLSKVIYFYSIIWQDPVLDVELFTTTVIFNIVCKTYYNKLNTCKQWFACKL